MDVVVDGVEIIRASLVEARRVLRLTLADGRQTAADLEAQVTGFLHYARETGLDLSRQWLAVSAGRVLNACTWAASPGRSAMLLLPHGRRAGGGSAVSRALVARALEAAEEDDTRLAQCLIELDDEVNRRALEAEGFFELAVLLYLERAVGGAIVTARGAISDDTDGAGITWLTYGPTSHGAFSAIIEATYSGSRDCPKLTGLREIEEILLGHKASGRFDPAHWMLACVDGQPVGCILLSENPLRAVLDVTYMGVCPDARRRGIGSALLRRAFEIAQTSGIERLTLAVDSTNEPAMRLYGGFGFSETARRRAMVRSLATVSSASLG